MANKATVKIESKYDKKGTDQAKKGIDSVDKSTKKTSKSITGLNKETKDTKKAFLNSTIAITAAVVAFRAVTAVVGDLINTYAVQEQAEARLEQTIKSTGEAAGLTSEQLISMAEGLQGVTKYGDEAIIGAESLLLTFKEIGGDVFPRALESILDVSEAMGTGLKESSIQVGKALNDPITGLTALRRVGIQFSNSQEELIRGFVKVNDLASAQDVILEELESQFGGVARAAADTATGSFVQLGNTIGDLKEQIGQNIAEGLQPMAEATDTIVRKLADWIEKKREINNFLSDFKDGTIEAAVEMDTFNGALKLAEARLLQATNAGRGHTEGLQAEVDALKIAIAQRARAAALDAQYADAKEAQDEVKAAALTLEIAQNDAETEALTRLEEIRVSSLTTDEKKLELIQAEINELWKYKDVAEVLQLINELAEQRAEIQNKITEGVKKDHTEIVAAGEDYLSILTEEVEKLKLIDDMMMSESLEEQGEQLAQLWADGVIGTELYLEALGRIEDAEQLNIENAETRMQEKIDLITTYSSAAMGLISAISSLQSASDDADVQSLEEKLDAKLAAAEAAGASDGELKALEEKNAEELDAKKRKIAHDEAIRSRNYALLEVAINTASAIIRMLVNPGGIAGIALSAFAAATGAIQVAAISAAPIPALATGGSFTTSGSQLYKAGDNTSGREKVTVERVEGSSNSGSTERVYAIVDGSEGFWMTLQRGIDNRQIHSTAGGAI